MSDTETTASPADERHRLRRSLGFRDLVVYGLLFIAPVAPVGVFGTLDARSHGAVALVYVVATVAMGFTAFSYAQMVRVVPQAGSVFAYARVGLGSKAGFIAGWMAMLDYVLIPAVACLFSGIAMNALVPQVSRGVWTALAVVVTTLLNLWGVRAAALVGFLVLALEIVVLLVFVVAALVVPARDGAVRGPWSPLSDDGTQGPFAVSAVIGAVSVAVLSYLGFDAIATFADVAARERGGVFRGTAAGGAGRLVAACAGAGGGAAITVAVIVEASGVAQVVGAVWLVVGVLVLVGQRGHVAASE
ncbi:APC family permease [Streptomyces sp. NPDC002589]|uniref:APC family permease n=1 Tax=Streptomyces sp. NPDC002589 TaxID=3154420 RepID=UPI0033217C74